MNSSPQDPMSRSVGCGFRRSVVELPGASKAICSEHGPLTNIVYVHVLGTFQGTRIEPSTRERLREVLPPSASFAGQAEHSSLQPLFANTPSSLPRRHSYRLDLQPRSKV
jgi:hypothetical protein